MAIFHLVTTEMIVLWVNVELKMVLPDRQNRNSYALAELSLQKFVFIKKCHVSLTKVKWQNYLPIIEKEMIYFKTMKTGEIGFSIRLHRYISLKAEWTVGIHSVLNSSKTGRCYLDTINIISLEQILASHILRCLLGQRKARKWNNPCVSRNIFLSTEIVWNKFPKDIMQNNMLIG